MTLCRVTPFHRADDWPPELHAACSRYEQEAQNAIDGRANWMDSARAEFSRQMRLLDIRRRPHFYARGSR